MGKLKALGRKLRSKLCFDFDNQVNTKSNMYIAERRENKVNKKMEKNAKQREGKKKEEETKGQGGRVQVT